ncbi:MAG: twitch domain-containing radical SAM protein, partial [Pseudobdellovibrio sp.]
MTDNKSKEYHSGAEEMREKLNGVSPSFCLAKWMMVSMHLTNGKTQSCYHPPAHDIPTEGLSENPGLLHNTEIKITERQQMRKGERPAGCKYCWAVEDAKSTEQKGHLSDRHYRSSEWWVSDQLEKIKMGDLKLDQSVTPAYVEVNFNQACNFKCIYCSPHISSEWQKESELHGAFHLEGFMHNNIPGLEKAGLMPLNLPNNENPYVKAFWQWWPQIYPNLKVFRMTGGEPLLDANTWKVLDYVLNHPKTDLEIGITSNLCPPKAEIFEKFINYLQALEKTQIFQELNADLIQEEHTAPAIKHFMLFVSCDSVGAQAEYIRSGMNFNYLKSNVLDVLNKTNGTAISF